MQTVFYLLLTVLPTHTHTVSHIHAHPTHTHAPIKATNQCVFLVGGVCVLGWWGVCSWLVGCVFSVGGVCIAVAPADNARNVIVPYYSTLFDNSLYEYGFPHPCSLFSFYKGVLPPLLSEIPKRATKV